MNINVALRWWLLLVMLIAVDTNAFAEQYVEVFYGNSSVDKQQTRAKASSYHGEGCGWLGCYSAGRSSYFGGGARLANHNFDDLDILGARYGFWFEERAWHGFSVDVRQLEFNSYWEGAVEQFNGYSSNALVHSSDIDVIPVTLMYNLRYGVQKSAKYVQGRLQFYAGLKLIGYNYYDGTVQTNLNETQNFKFSHGSSSNIGDQDYRLGVMWYLTPNIATTLEYRKTELPISLNRSDKNSTALELTGFKFEHDLNQIYVGLLYTF